MIHARIIRVQVVVGSLAVAAAVGCGAERSIGEPEPPPAAAVAGAGPAAPGIAADADDGCFVESPAPRFQQCRRDERCPAGVNLCIPRTFSWVVSHKEGERWDTNYFGLVECECLAGGDPPLCRVKQNGLGRGWPATAKDSETERWSANDLCEGTCPEPGQRCLAVQVGRGEGGGHNGTWRCVCRRP